MERKFIVSLLIFFVIFLISCSFKNKFLKVAETSLYRNEELGILLKYPADWKANNRSSLLGNLSSHFFGNTGFFAINVIDSNSMDLESIIKKESETGDYGSAPEIKKIIQNAKIGYIILPSNDQSPEEKQRSCFITELQNYFKIDEIEYDMLILFADQKHIHEIINSLEYI